MTKHIDIINDALDRVETSIAELTQMVIAMPTLHILATNIADLPSKKNMIDKVKECEKFGIAAKIHEVAPGDMFEVIDELAEDLNNKIIIQSNMGEDYPPLADLLRLMNPLQDVDGFSVNMQELSIMRQPNDFITHPCYSPAAKGTLLLNMLVDPEIKGKDVVILGNGVTSGLPISNMYNALGATTINLNSKSNPIVAYDSLVNADVVVSCTGVDIMHMLDASMYLDTICINVGMRSENKKLLGDLNYDLLKDYAKFINPVEGSICELTTLFLIYNCLASQMTHEVISYNNNLEY